MSFQPPRRLTTRRGFLGLGAATLVLPALSACGALTGPRPDPVIAALHALASSDLAALEQLGTEAEATAAVRRTQLAALQREIQRSCGTAGDGTTPQQCLDTNVQAAPVSANKAALIVSSARTSPLLREAFEQRSALEEDYAARLAVAVDAGCVIAARAAGASWESLEPQWGDVDMGSLIGGAQEYLEAALQAEYATIYGLGLAAEVPAALTEALSSRADRHRRLRDAIIAVYRASEIEPPVAAPAYRELPGGVDHRSAPIAFAAALEWHASQAWEAVARYARSAEVRAFALQAAGVVAAGAAGLDQVEQPSQELEALPGLAPS